MALPSSWVDHLFARLTVRYGAAFLRQWPDTDLAVVKADWADVLDGVRGEPPVDRQALVDLLERDGVQIARRTVAKYRDQLGVLPARMRKRL